LNHLPDDACADRLYGPDLHLAGGVGSAGKADEPKAKVIKTNGPKPLVTSNKAENQVRAS
ncbi:MAG: hypothetical protein ACR2RA_18465, partial [Geminicoccaceae bacterium]